jgi:predicted DNA-binding transcriptional regulator
MFSYYEVLCGMSRDQVFGMLLMVLAVAVIIIYGWIVFFTKWSLLLLQVTGFVAVVGVFEILTWIGYMLDTTPPPKLTEKIEKKLEEELKNLESKSAEEAKEHGS